MDTSSSFVISFEFFPPKTKEGLAHLCETATILADYRPDFFSVTFGAGGSTREGTVETVKLLQQTTAVCVAPHLSCIGESRRNLADILECYRSLGVQHLVALRGDLPSGMGHAGEFKFASELVALIRKLTGDYFHIDVAAYPEVHPQAMSARDDLLNLKRKYEAGANSAITQYFFNPDAYFYYREACLKENIYLPLVPGIMPIMQFNKLVQFSDRCGAEIPRWIRKRLESYGDDKESIQAFGLEVVDHLCERLIAGGVPGLHFYTLNQAKATVNVLNKLIGARLLPENVV